MCLCILIGRISSVKTQKSFTSQNKCVCWGIWQFNKRVKLMKTQMALLVLLRIPWWDQRKNSKYKLWELVRCVDYKWLRNSHALYFHLVSQYADCGFIVLINYYTFSNFIWPSPTNCIVTVHIIVTPGYTWRLPYTGLSLQFHEV